MPTSISESFCTKYIMVAAIELLKSVWQFIILFIIDNSISVGNFYHHTHINNAEIFLKAYENYGEMRFQENY